MLISGSLFAAGVVSIAWERAPAWRAADDARFRVDFAYTLRRVDQLQPALLLLCLASTVGFVIAASGSAVVLAAIAAACLLTILIGSGIGLVPIQRRLAASGTDIPGTEVERLRTHLLSRPRSP